jgi:hypothetical protein
MSDSQEDGGSSDAFSELWDRRPRMTYEGLSLVFNEVGDLIIEQRDAGDTTAQVTIPQWQLNLVLEFVKQHRLSPMQAGLASAFSRRHEEAEQSDLPSK